LSSLTAAYRRVAVAAATAGATPDAPISNWSFRRIEKLRYADWHIKVRDASRRKP
jgi:hypothetical protein